MGRGGREGKVEGYLNREGRRGRGQNLSTTGEEANWEPTGTSRGAHKETLRAGPIPQLNLPLDISLFYAV